MMRKILAALDGSKTSESVLPFLEEFLRNEDADVTLARVARGDRLTEHQELEAYLKGLSDGLKNKGAIVKAKILAGDPAEELVKYAVEEGFHLILMCTRGKTGLKLLILGSVATEVLKTSPVPVVIVHPAEKGQAPPKIRRIVVPLDGSHRSASILPAVADMAKAMEAKIGFVTVVNPAKKDEMPVEVVAENIFREQKKLQKRGLEVEIAILYGDPATEAMGFAERNHADLVAIATHGRTGLERLRYGSVAEQILKKSRIPLMVVRTATTLKPHPLHLGYGLRRRTPALAGKEK
jgi:nucleotide-binding universal stress UspA family protein